ncbi:MAG: hypothetical protein IPG07_05360 [Crocinitomicaceae bacterium]|nr:hypothetical protein [Crocinitomicaceae bacterium]
MAIFKNTFIPLILVSFIVLTSFTKDTQWPAQYGEATIDANYCVKIDVTKPLESFYKLEISHLNFSTAIDAQKVFGSISNNYLSYKVDFANQVTYLQIHANRTKELKDVIWWNDYIQSLCKN